MKLVWIFFMIQLLPAMCKPMSIYLIAKKFQHKFTQLSNTSFVLRWQILKNSKISQPQEYKSNNIKFDSDKTYLIFTQSEPKQLCVFYWVGSTASLAAKTTAAKYALHLYSSLSDFFKDKVILSLHREEEYIESKFLQNAVKFGGQTFKKGYLMQTLYKHDAEKLPYEVPNLYIVRGKSTTRIKAVPMGTQWFINDTCIILESGYMVDELQPVTTYCGPHANQMTFSHTVNVGSIISFIYDNVDRRPLNKHNPMFKIFLEVLENRENYRTHEVDESDDHLKDPDTFVIDRNRRISFYRIFQRQMTKIDPRPYVSFSNYYDNVEMFHIDGCYLLDSASVAGLFFQMYSKTFFEDRLIALEMVEKYVHNKYSIALKPTRMRITEINPLVIMPVNLSINLSNFPIAEFEEYNNISEDE